MEGGDTINSIEQRFPKDHGGLLITSWPSVDQCKVEYASLLFTDFLKININHVEGSTDPVLSILAREDLERITNIDIRARQSQTAWQQQFGLMLPTGTQRVQGHAFYVQYGGTPPMRYLFLHYVAPGRDYNQPIRADAIKDDLEGIVELSPGGHYAIRLEPEGNSKLIYASRKVQQIIGLDMNEFVHDAKKMFAHIHPDDASRFHAGRTEAVRKCEGWRVEFRIRKDNGNESWIELTIQPFKQEDGSVIWYGILLNIDQRKNLELARQLAFDELKESEYKHRMLAENLESPVIIIDEDGTFHYANHAAEFFFGVARVDLIGRKWPETITPLEWEHRKPIIARVLSEGRKFADVWCVAPDGRKRYIKRLFIPLNHLGKITRVLITITDITSEVLLEKLLAEQTYTWHGE